MRGCDLICGSTESGAVAAEVADDAEGEGRNAAVRWTVALSAMFLLRLVVSQVGSWLLSLAIARRDDLASGMGCHGIS
jgi:hypothetical protein